jgi:hypothetical protein
VPAVCLAGSVLEREGVDPIALLDGVLLVGFAGVERIVDGLEGNRGWELVCYQSQPLSQSCSPSHNGVLGSHVPFLRDIVAVVKSAVCPGKCER